MKIVSLKISLSIAVLATLLLGLPVWADDYSDKMQFADGLYTRQMHELAAREYASLIKKYPEGEKNDAVTFRLAECLRHMGKAKEAGRLYSNIVYKYKTSPFRLRAAYRRARLYMQAGDYESAIDHLEVILSEKPPANLAAAATFYLGEAQLKAEKKNNADQTFAKVVNNYPQTMFFAHALMYRGEIYRDKWLKIAKKSKGDDKLAEKALGFFEKALQSKAGDRVSAEALYQMAEIRFRQQHFEQSSEYYHRLMTRYPNDERAASARLQAAWSAANAGLHAEALALADKALGDTAITKNRAEWLYLKANAQRQLMQNRDAITTYLTLMNKYPQSRFVVPARYEIAVTYFKMGKYQDAIHHAEMIRITPALRSDVCWLLAESYAALKKSAEAIQYYRMVIRDNPTSDRARDALYRLAYHLQNQGYYREASQTYNKLVAQFPKSELAPQALYASAFSLEKAKAYEDAVRDWRRLISDYPNSKYTREAIYQKAMCEIRLERKEAASTSLDELLRRYPDERFTADAYYWKGMLSYELKKYSAAESALRKAMQKSSREELKNDAAFQLGLALQKLKRPEESAAIFKKLMDSPASGRFSPALLEWLSTWYNTHNESLKSEDAAVLLIKSTKEPAWKQTGWVLLGRARDKLGKKKDARLAYRHAIEISINTHYASEAALWLGDICLTEKQGAEAAKYFNIAIAKSIPENQLAVRAHASFGLGRAAEIGQNYAQASRYFMSVAILYDDPKLVPEALYRAALSYDRLKRAADRDKAAQELVQRYPQSSWTRKVDKSWLH